MKHLSQWCPEKEADCRQVVSCFTDEGHVWSCVFVVIYPPEICYSCMYIGTNLLGSHVDIPRPRLAKVGL